MVDDQLKVLPAVWAKRRDGLLLDVGHGSGSFSFPVARAMLDQGLVADFLGSDLHAYNLHGPVYDLVTTLAKFLHLGMSLFEIVRRASTNPAKFLGMEGVIGTLRPGACADVSVLSIESAPIRFVDSEGHVELGERRLEPRATLRAGKVVEG